MVRTARSGASRRMPRCWTRSPTIERLAPSGRAYGRADGAAGGDARRGGCARARGGDRSRAPRAGRRGGGGARRIACGTPAASSSAPASATAFGDYVAGSNHVLPTGGAARFQSAAVAGHVPAAHGSRILAARGRRSSRARRRGSLREPRAFLCTQSQWSAAREPHLADPSHHGRDRRPAVAGPRRHRRGRAHTGVGFFDHLLDAVARHGLARPRRAASSGDLETGSHHTVEDTGIALGQALDEALGDRSGIRRFGHAVVPMDEARASAAIDISGRPFTSFEGEFPAERVGDFETELDRGVPPRGRERRQAHAARAGRGRHERAPHGRGVVQGVRARAARGRRERRPGGGRALDQGRPLTRDRDPRLRHGEPALGGQGARARGRGAVPDEQTTRACARPAAIVLPGVGAMPKAMERVRELALDGLLRERVEAACP